MFRAGERQSLEDLNERFADVPPPLAVNEARIEAARCLFCFDAPCTRACPTHIDVPRFIRQILHRDEIGAARTILEANIFGGSCARPVPRKSSARCLRRSNADESAGADRSAPAVRLRLRRRARHYVLRGRLPHGKAGRCGRLGTGWIELRPRADHSNPLSRGGAGLEERNVSLCGGVAGELRWSHRSAPALSSAFDRRRRPRRGLPWDRRRRNSRRRCSPRGSSGPHRSRRDGGSDG